MRGGGASSATIPPGARKLVQVVKEVATGHGDDEIFAMLQECNMDPNETAQRLMSQDTFHEVKRRKDRKKEASSTNKESSEGRSRGSGSYRGGRGGGRSVARYVSSETNGRGKGGTPRENGSHASNMSSVSAPETKPAPPPPQVQLIPQSGSSLSSAGGLPNGSVHYQASGGPTQIPWSKIAGHATMAEMLKSQQSAGALQMPKPQPQRQQVHQPQAPQAPHQQFPSSGMYSSSDPVHHPSFTDHQRSSNVIKREIGIVGNQRSFGDRGGLPSPPSQASSSQDDLRPVSPPQDSNKSQEPPVAASSTEGLRSNVRPPYQPPGTGSKTSGINLEWKPKLAAQDDAPETEALKFPTSSVIPEPEVISVSGKFQGLSTREEHQQVIMPNNFQSQGDLGLSFGSFGESFGSSIPSGFRSEEVIEVSSSPEASVPAKDILHDESPDGADIDAEDDPVHHQDEIPAQRDNLAPNTAPSISSAAFTSQADISKLRAQQYSYLQSSQGYSSGIGMVSQIPSSQHMFDSQESHLQDALKQQHYSDSGTSFYSPSFRPSSDGDARYQYLPTNTKYANGAVVMASQQHLPAHEVATSSTLSSSSTTSANTHSIQAQQQPVVHAYPAQPTGVPVGHHFGNVFGYQYPYTYMHSPYQHSYTNYPQPPVSSYSPASGSYSPAAAAAVAAAAVKYPVPQYKPGTATANAQISSMSGYGTGYGTGASSMYAGNPGATGGNTPGYEDASGSQYKESNLYMHGPQGDGARGWNDQASSFYTSQHSSYTQQPSSAHTHPAMASYTSLYHHPAAAAAAAAQQQQAGAAAAAAGGHQMIQQPQGLSGAAGSSQVGATTAYHQQLQRMQQQPSWNTY